jgi:hypothetical protein
MQICQPEGENNPRRVDKSGCFPTQRGVIVLLYFCQCFIGYLPCWGKFGCSAGNNRVVRWGTIGLFPGNANVCQCLIGYLPCGWKLDCSAGSNRVFRRGTIGLFPGNANVCQCLICYLPCGGKLIVRQRAIGLFGGEQ